MFIQIVNQILTQNEIYKQKYLQSQDIVGTIISIFICNFLLRDVSTKSSSVGLLSRYSTKFDIIKNAIVRKQMRDTKNLNKKNIIVQPNQ